MPRTLIALATLCVATTSLTAQVVTEDEGSFTITRAGAAVGREEFRITSSATKGGKLFLARAQISLDSLRLFPALSTDERGAPQRYQVEVKNGTVTIELLKGQLLRGRFSAQVQTTRGESAREFVTSANPELLDDDVFHQYFFLAKDRRFGEVPVVIPRRNAQVVMHVEDRGPDQVTVSGRSLAGRHLTLRDADGVQRDVWVDANSRVLRVEIPSQRLVATRDDPPR